MTLFINSTYNEYVFQMNLLLVGGVFLANYLVLHYELEQLNFLLFSKPFLVLETLFVLNSLLNMWWSSRQHVQPSLSNYKPSLQKYILDDGPLVAAFYRLLGLGEVPGQVNNTANNKQPTPPANKKNVRTLMSDALATGISLEPTTSNIQTPSFSFLRRNPQKEAISLDNPLEQLVQANTQDTSFLGNFSSKKLAFQPCFNPPAAPTKHRDHSLWSLDRKQEIVDDFREEQIENLRKNWDKFDAQTTKAISNKLRQRIIDDIIKPILQTADVLDQFLANTGQTFADCTQNTMAYLMLSQAWKTLNISLSPVEMKRLTNMPNYDSVKARKYIIQRMKELSGSENMARFRYIAAEPDLPTDSQIIIHLVETYISIKNPSVIPPLIQDHFGDVFKYLVIYFYITPELDWKLFDNATS